VIGVPFLATDNNILFLHVIIVPFMMAHWFANDNMCTLTVIEKHVRKQVYGNGENAKTENCFTCRLIEPIYDFDKNFDNFQIFVYIFTACLWFGSLYKLYLNYKNGRLKSIRDLFTK
jgi:hypothetical protein